MVGSRTRPMCGSIACWTIGGPAWGRYWTMGIGGKTFGVSYSVIPHGPCLAQHDTAARNQRDTGAIPMRGPPAEAAAERKQMVRHEKMKACRPNSAAGPGGPICHVGDGLVASHRARVAGGCRTITIVCLIRLWSAA